MSFNDRIVVIIKSLIGQLWKYVPHRRVFVWRNEISSFDKYYASSDMHSQAYAYLKSEIRNEIKVVGHSEKAFDID